MKGKIAILIILLLLLWHPEQAIARSEENQRIARLISDLLNADQAITTLSIVGCLEAGSFYFTLCDATNLNLAVNFTEIISSVIKNTSQALSVSYEEFPLVLNQTIEVAWAHRKLYVTDLERCPEQIQVFLIMNKQFFEHPFHWLFFLTENQASMFERMSVLLASNVVLAFKENQTEFKLIQGEYYI